MNFQRDLSLFFLRLRGICIQDSLWKRRERRKTREKKKAFSSVFVRSVFILLRKERNNVFLCVVVCFFSRVSVFLRTTSENKKKSKKMAGEKSITFLISNACSNSSSTARWIWSLENWFLMSFDVWECIFTRSSARSKTVKFLCFVVERKSKDERLLLLCVFEFFLNFFSPLLLFKNSNTQVSLLSALRCKKTLSFCVSIFYVCT